MSASEPSVVAEWPYVARAIALLAVDPEGLGGIGLRARPSPQRSQIEDAIKHAMPEGSPIRRLPLNIRDDRLLGGLDLAATLAAGKPIQQRGVLAEVAKGLLVVTSAERLDAGTAARLAAAMDKGRADNFAVLALDEGIEPDERTRDTLLDRLAFRIDLDAISPKETVDAAPYLDRLNSARSALDTVTIPDSAYGVIATCAAGLGVDSARAAIFTLRAARAVAALEGHTIVADSDLARAVELVLAPRATRLPASEPDDESAPANPDDAKTPDTPESSEEQSVPEPEELADMVLAAAQAAIPQGLLERLRSGTNIGRQRGQSGSAGIARKSLRRGRPVGSRSGDLRGGARLNVIDTLRAAAPWQTLRRRLSTGDAVSRRRVYVRKEDFRIQRYKEHAETTTVFVVDASGSSALHRLAEAKGAVELLLADCYVRRDSVALIAFRGRAASVILPPTRSLLRAKRALAGLPGGGATPIALALDMTFSLADGLSRKGQTPTIILLTDGRANIGRDGKPGRPKAEAEALEAARGFRMNAIRSLVIDTSPSAADQSRRLADAMGATYLPLPYADARTLSRAALSITAN